MRGNLHTNGNKIINVFKPIKNTEVVNKDYVDEILKIFKINLIKQLL